MSTFSNHYLIYILFFVLIVGINSLRILSQLPDSGDVLDISGTELSKILGRKQIRTNRKLLSRSSPIKPRNPIIDPIKDSEFESLNEKSKPNVLETHRIVINFTENTMKLYENEGSDPLKVEGRQNMPAINQCINLLEKKEIFSGDTHRIKEFCSAIYSINCDTNCVRNRIKKKSI